MENLDSWQLVQLNAFDDACKKADIEFEQTKRVPSLRHKWFALAHLMKYDEAAMLASEIIKLSYGNTEFDFLLSGIALWLLNKKEEAVLEWKRGEKSMYKDAAGGLESQLMLFFAAIRINDEKLKNRTVKAIQKLLKSKGAVNWPGPMGHFILGSLSEEELRSIITGVSILHERQSCQADFVIGIKKLEGGSTEEYKAKLLDAVGHGVSAYLEPMYYLAKGELSDK